MTPQSAIRLSTNQRFLDIWHYAGMSVVWVNGSIDYGKKWEIAVKAWDVSEDNIKDRMQEHIERELSGIDIEYFKRISKNNGVVYIARFYIKGLEK